MATSFNLDEVQEKIKQVRRETLVLLSNQAQNYFLASFKNQGLRSAGDWKEVQRRTPGTRAYKYPKNKGLQRRTSPILTGAGYRVRGGTLRRAVSAMARTADINDARLRMIVDLPYANIINEGGKNMPKREYVAQTDELTRMQRGKIEKIFKGVWNTK